MVKIRLAVGGKSTVYKIVVANSTSPRDGKAIEYIGYYHPLEKKDKNIHCDIERLKFWINNGAQPTVRVFKILQSLELGDALKNFKLIQSAPQKKYYLQSVKK